MVTPSGLRGIVSTVAPDLGAAGFVRRGHVFRRTRGDVTDVMEFTTSKRANVAGRVAFYVDIAVYVPTLARLVGDEPINEPREYDGTLRGRIDSFAPDAPEHYEQGTAGELPPGLVDHLRATVEALDTLGTVDDVVAVLARRQLAAYQEVVAHYVERKDEAALRAFVHGLYEDFGSEPRWRILAQKMTEVLTRSDSTIVLTELAVC